MIISYGPVLSFRSSFFPYPPLPIPSSSVDSASGEEWSSWSVCSATCGEGWQSRTRFCVSSSYSTQCSGPLREQRPCNNSAVCPGKLPPPTPKSLLLPPCAHLALSRTLPHPYETHMIQRHSCSKSVAYGTTYTSPHKHDWVCGFRDFRIFSHSHTTRADILGDS